MSSIGQWILNNYVEIIAALLGLIYIYFSIREKIWLWLTGILTSAFYIYVYFVNKFYADMSLQVYYLIISVYGWIYWKKGGKKEKNVKIKWLNLKTALQLLFITIVIFAFYVFILSNYTNSDVVIGDAFTTALSITATYMIAKKYIEQWLIWIVVDIVSAVLYFHKQMYATVILFIVYTILAVVGFISWYKKLKSDTEN